MTDPDVTLDTAFSRDEVGHRGATPPAISDAAPTLLQLLMRLLREQAPRYWQQYLATLILMAVLAGCVTATAFLIGNVVNATYLARDFDKVVLLCAAIIALFLLKGLVQYAQAILLSRTRTDMTATYQKRWFERLLGESMEHLSGVHSAETLSRMDFSTTAPAKVMSLLINGFGREGLSILGLSAVMIYQEPIMALACLITAPVAVFFARSSRRRVNNIALESFQARSSATEIVQETLHGMRVIKAFRLETPMRERAERRIEIVREMDQEIARLSWRSVPWVEALSGCAVALIILYGSYRIISLGASLGEFTSFLTAFLLAYEPAKRLSQSPVDLASASAGLRTLYETLDTEPSEPDDSHKPALVVTAGRIVLDDVTFDYRKGEPVLRGLSLTAPPGTVTALVGHSGSGKSTIFSLLLRLYECRRGAILIDGQNIANVARSSVRDAIAYLGQDIFLFHGTIGENIAVGKIGASQDEVVAAAQAAQAHEFIMGFPGGYDTSVGENGLKLSSGQRQRIAIARAFLKDAPIILLDEPTASLDSISEREIQRAIARLCKDRTTLVIAHRLHTIVEAPSIYVIGNGRALESGNHVSLLANGPTYRSLQMEMVE